MTDYGYGHGSTFSAPVNTERVAWSRWLRSACDSFGVAVVGLVAIAVTMLAGIGVLMVADAVFATEPARPAFSVSDYCMTDNELPCDEPVTVDSYAIRGGGVTVVDASDRMATVVPVNSNVLSEWSRDCLVRTGARGFQADGSETLYAPLSAVARCA